MHFEFDRDKIDKEFEQLKNVRCKIFLICHGLSRFIFVEHNFGYDVHINLSEKGNNGRATCQQAIEFLREKTGIRKLFFKVKCERKDVQFFAYSMGCKRIATDKTFAHYELIF